ncbi:lipase family protein [Nocardia lijiangensis]|uniref:lipase family protein n=1 Tax=Nocardia lijiangensis TaxID=299618 RepID=UPI000A01FC18|nr:lipase family protein [Nocardia lijiangensis]
MAARRAVPKARPTAATTLRTGWQQTSSGARRRLRRLALAALAAACLGHAVPAAAQPIYPIPDADGFYAAPSDLAGFQPGDVLRSRVVPTTIFPGSTVWQLLFRTVDSAGEPIAAVTTVLVPPGGGPDRPLVSYQPFVNSLGMQCAPSHSLFDGGVREAPALNLLLARGWAVAVPDHLGPTSAYGAAQLGGRITLDGLRAAKRFAPTGLANSPVGLAGYSGGGMATGFAAALAPEYAPELPLVGVAMGGVVVNIGKLARDLGARPNPLFGLGFAAAMGLEREYPGQMEMSRILNPSGRALRDQIANACAEEIISAGADRSFSDVLDGDLEADPSTVRVLRENSLETFPAVPRAPVYQWHGENDDVDLDLVREVTVRYCRAGTPVQFDVIPGADHGAASIQGAPRAFGYLSDRFAGLPAPSNC